MKTATRFPRPTVVVSRCLCGARCRWDGDSSPSNFVKELKQYARVIPVCPEIEIGLGVPRERIVLVRRGQGVDLYQPSSGLRLAQKMRTLTRRCLEECGDVDGFILKHKSPSCGLRGVKLYESTTPNAAFVRNGVGIFAAEAVRNRPEAAFVDEERLDDPTVREHFLTRLFTMAAWRAAKRRRAVISIRRFFDHNHLLLAAYSRRLTHELETITRSLDPHRLGCAEIEQCEKLLHHILQKTPRLQAQGRPFELALEHYSTFLSETERRRFRAQLGRFFEGDEPLSEIRKTVQIWAVRYDKNFIRERSFFRPYPGPLAEA